MRGQRDALIWQLIHDGWSRSQVAARFSLTERTVMEIHRRQSARRANFAARASPEPRLTASSRSEESSLDRRRSVTPR